jgi:hypothetical protein
MKNLKLTQKEINGKINDGYLHTRAIVEILGKPKEYVEETLKGYIVKITNNEDIILLKEDYQKPKEVEAMWSAFSEIEFLAKDITVLMGFCFDYMPSSVEIIAPEKIIYDTNDFTDFLNDMQARLHAVNMGLQELQKHNENLVVNTSVLIKNFTYHLLRPGEKSVPELSKIVGIKEDELVKVLDALSKEGKIIKKGDLYSIRK